MSFSKDVKDELSRQISSARHCLIAETAAVISLCGRILITEHDRYIFKNTYRKYNCRKKVLYFNQENI